jgi:putative glutamine amidotransferase
MNNCCENTAIFYPINMKIGLTVRRENEGFFIRERYLKYFKDFEVVFLTPYNIDYACDAYVILGGNDANPKLYNEENTASVEIDDLIDELDMNVIDYAVKHKKPLYGICRGLQMINVYFGGSLKQDIINHRDTNHKILSTKQVGSFSKEEIVNSLHHQSIKKLGEGLEIVYISEDDEVEFIVHKSLPILATQFHPEMQPDSGISNILNG